MKSIKYIIILLLLLIPLESVSADTEKDAAFNDLIESLRDEGTIPRERGNVISFGNYEDQLSNMGIAQWFTITEADNFVLSAKVSWLSASETPSGSVSGCGFVFGADPESTNHLMASIRMDGFVYVSGTKNMSALSYGRYYYANPWWEGSSNIMLILNGDTISFYMDGQKMFSYPGVLIQGNGVGLATLSGTNKDFGTKCIWEDIYLFSWK